MSSPSSSIAPTRVPGAVLAGAALAAVLGAALVGGAAAAPAIGDPGPVVRWGVLLVRVIHDLAAATTVGLLLVAAFLAPETTQTNRRVTATRTASATAAVWALAGIVGVLFTFAGLAGIRLSTPGFFTQFTTFVWELEITRVAVISLLLAAVVAAGAARRPHARRHGVAVGHLGGRRAAARARRSCRGRRQPRHRRERAGPPPRGRSWSGWAGWSRLPSCGRSSARTSG